MIDIKIRGIYTTAIVRLMMKKGYRITYPTEVIRRRFGLEERREVPEVEIFDNIRERQGVVIVGKERGVREVREVFREEFEESIIRDSESGWNTICKGEVIKVLDGGRGVIVEVKDGSKSFQGILDGYDGREGDEVIVAVKFPNFGYIRAKLSRNIVIPGEHVILIKADEPRISRKIKDIKRREELKEISRRVNLISDEWNLLWRTSAEVAGIKELEEEVEELNKVLDEVLKKLEGENGNEVIIYKGLPGFYIEFPWSSKRRLDKLREEVLETITGHHYLKSVGSEYMMVVDFAELLLKRNGEREEWVRKTFEEFIRRNMINRGKVGIEHVKIDGRVFRLSPGLITEIERNGEEVMFVLERNFRGDGSRLYDGLRVPIENGDYGRTELKLGKYYYKTEYYSRNGELKGIYYNINTPVEVNRDVIRYVDLEVDVVQMPDGKIRVEDKEILDNYYINGYISLKLKEKAIRVVRGIIEDIKG